MESTAAPSRWDKTATLLLLATTGNALLLRYLHVQGIEVVYMDLLSAPQAGLPILGLTMLLLLVLALGFAMPVWLLGGMLQEVSDATIPEQPARPVSLVPPRASEWIRRLGLWPQWCIWRNGREEKIAATTSVPSRRWGGLFPALSLIGVGWGLQTWGVLRENDLPTYAVAAAISVVSFLIGIAVARVLHKPSAWWVGFGFIHLFSGLFVLLFLFMASAALDGHTLLAVMVTLLIYVFAILIYVRTATRANQPGQRFFGAFPESWSRWWPGLLAVAFLTIELVFLQGDQLLRRAGQLVGIENKGQALLLLPPPRGDEQTQWLPSGWHTFPINFHFGALDVPCEDPDGRCYLVRDGVVLSFFIRTENKSGNEEKNHE